MKYLGVILILLLLFSDTFSGNYANDYLNLGVSARELAMGNSCGALNKTSNSFLSNPAGLAYENDNSVNLMYMDQYGLARLNYLGYSFGKASDYTLAVNWIRYSVIDIPRRPDLFLSGEHTEEARKREILKHRGTGFGYFSNVENNLYLSFARMFHYNIFLDWMFKNLSVKIPVGVNLKLLHKKLDQSQAYGLGADFGARCQFDFGELIGNGLGDISLGIMLKDMTETNIYWETQHLDKIPPTLETSIAFEQSLPVFDSILSLSLSRNNRYEKEINAGLEYSIKRVVAIRAGHNYNGFSGGCGLFFRLFNIQHNLNYAFHSHAIGNSHRIGILLWF